MESKITKILQAIKFATIKHKDQLRKNSAGLPYIVHPQQVALILSSVGIEDTSVILGAILHDTVEDTDTTLDEIDKLFGSDIAIIVSQVTDDKSLDKVERKKRQIVRASSNWVAAKLVKMADKISNIEDLTTDPPKNWSKEEIMGYAYWCLAVCRQMKGLHFGLEERFYNEIMKLGIDPKCSDEILKSKVDEYYQNICNSE